MKLDAKIVELTNAYGDWFKGKFELPTMTNNLHPYDNLFSPIEINNTIIKNRLVMGPIGNVNMADETGRPSTKMIKYFEERASGGIGLITTGLVPTSYGIDPTITEKGKLSYFPRIDRSRTVLVGWRNLSAAVHSHGAHIFIQLTAGLGRVGNPQVLLTQKKFPVSASFNPNYYIPQIPSIRLTDRKITKIIKNTGQAAADAKAANIDGVYLHGHEGYLMEQLTNPAFNRRKRGKYANWQRFGLDMVKEIRERCGDKYPIMYRIDLSLALNETYGENMDDIKSLKKFKNGRTIDDTLRYMENLVTAGVDIFDVDLGCYDNWWLPHPPSSMPSGCFLDIAEIVKSHFKAKGIISNAGKEVPIVAVGKLGYPDLAEQALIDNKCDMIMLARPLLADAQWPNKAYAGNTESITPCIGCHECITEFVEGGHPQCAVSPRTAFEHELPQEVPRAEIQKRVAVVGAGPAGVVASDVLLKRGHIVDLYDKNDFIGGMLTIASKPKIKYEIQNYVAYLEELVNELRAQRNFKLHLDTEVTERLLKNKNYDTVLFATGSKQVRPAIDGANGDNVVTVVELLKNPEIVNNIKNVVIIGGGDSGCETAYYLNYELNKNVDIIELEATLMNHSCTANRGHIIYYLQKGGVIVHNLARVKSITKKGVLMEKNIDKTVPSPFNTWQPILPENIKNPLAPKIDKRLRDVEIPADLVVLAMGTQPDNELFYAIQKSGAVKEVYNIGDSFQCGKVINAVRAAYRKALTI